MKIVKCACGSSDFAIPYAGKMWGELKTGFYEEKLIEPEWDESDWEYTDYDFNLVRCRACDQILPKKEARRLLRLLEEEGYI